MPGLNRTHENEGEKRIIFEYYKLERPQGSYHN